MPEIAGSRLGLQAISGTDYVHDIDTIDQAQIAILEAKGARIDTGTLSARPTSTGGTPGISGRFYFATDIQALYYDTGAGWRPLGSVAFRAVSGSVTAQPGDLINAAASSVIGLGAAVANATVTITTSSTTTGATPVTVNYGTGGGNIFGPGLGASGASSFLLGAPNVSVELQCDGANWNMVSGEQDTGWVALTLGGSVASSGYTPSARLIGDRVYLKGGLQYTGGGSSTVTATVPAGLRPFATVLLGGTTTGAFSGPYGVSITSAGALTSTSTLNTNGVQGLDGMSFTLS